MCFNPPLSQELLTSEKASSILKSIEVLPMDLDVAVYPTLVAIIHENEEARAVISKDFDVAVSFLSHWLRR